ncbi:hypothetical protein [Niveibacterium sp. SC-1]|uniref:hypothetical protein n=1 Tax=Niveibacterium sp. SC-1 TaxID=3135646 RepID=UPI00311F8136
MADIISVIGSKGGTGKTTLSHMLCHGLTLIGRRAVCVTTDEDRDPLSTKGRHYVQADARSPVAREKVVAKLRDLKGWTGVLDGGANRTEIDIALYQLSDVVLLPFRDSPEDFRAVIRDLDLFPRAFALPSQWPKNRFQQEAARRHMETWPEEFRDRLLPPVFSLSASKLLLQHEVPEDLPSTVNGACRTLAKQVLNLFEDDEEDVADQLAQARDAAEEGDDT